MQATAGVEHPGRSFSWAGSAQKTGGLRARRLALWKLTTIGEGPLADLFSRHATKSDGRLRYEEYLRQEGVNRAMRPAALLVMPSEWYEGFPLTTVEAFADGLPVVASRLGSMAEIVEDGRTGFISPRETPGI